MCHFFSCIATKKKIYSFYGVDSHEDIIERIGMDDSDWEPEFVRIELTPPDVFTTNYNLWTFIIDQDFKPEWCNSIVGINELKDRVVRHLSNKIKDDGNGYWKDVDGNIWFIGGDNAKDKTLIIENLRVRAIFGCRISGIDGLSKVGIMSDVGVSYISGSTCVNDAYKCKIHEMLGNSAVETMVECDVTFVSNNAFIRSAYGCKIMEVYGFGVIHRLCNNSHVDVMTDGSRIAYVNSSTIGVMRGNSIVNNINECSKINEVAGCSVLFLSYPGLKEQVVGSFGIDSTIKTSVSFF